MLVRVTSGSASGEVWRITQQFGDDFLRFGNETVSLGTQGLAAADTFDVYMTSAVARNPSKAVQRYMRIRMSEPTPEDDHRLGHLVIGLALDFDVPLDWSHTDNEQPNDTMYRTRGGTTWGFKEGPPQKVITGRIVGDVSEWRKTFRGLLRQIGYEVRPIALVQDDTNEDATLTLVRLKSGSQHDNAGWDFDTVSGEWFPLGDQSVTFEEVT